MKVLISPTKTMNVSSIDSTSLPLFHSTAKSIAKKIRKLSQEEIQDWMGISEKIAVTTFHWYQNFDQHTQPAALSYAGEGFKYLSYATLDSTATQHANDSLRILSALYGYLRPMDSISLYRLDLTYRMSKISSPSLVSIYQNKITKALLHETSESELILNCTSGEYTQLLDEEALRKHRNYVTIQFLQKKNNTVSSISMHSKKARGMFARWAIEHQATSIMDLHGFDLDGYTFSHQDDKSITFIKHLD